MRVLLILRKATAAIAAATGSTFRPNGGWLEALTEDLASSYDVELGVVFEGSEQGWQIAHAPGMKIYSVPSGVYTEVNPRWSNLCKEISEDFMPDIIHIQGTEYSIGLNYINGCGKERVLVVIQGLLSVYARYYLGGVAELPKYLTFRDIIKGDTINKQQQKFVKRGETERELLSTVNYIGGRTSWDRTHANFINPKAKYFEIGETMRSSFYKNKWEYAKCEPFSIFLSNGCTPLKGAHQVIKAAAHLRSKYPDIKIRIAGEDPISKPFYRIGGYGKYLKKLIKRLDMQKNVEFLGYLNEEEMLQQYLRANVFVCSSSIENSPNSLAEAQLVGMPYLSTYCGGTPDMIYGNTEALYRFEEVESLTDKLDHIFTLGANTQVASYDSGRYDRLKNYKNLIATYHEILALSRGQNPGA